MAAKVFSFSHLSSVLNSGKSTVTQASLSCAQWDNQWTFLFHPDNSFPWTLSHRSLEPGVSTSGRRFQRETARSANQFPYVAEIIRVTRPEPFFLENFDAVAECDPSSRFWTRHQSYRYHGGV